MEEQKEELKALLRQEASQLPFHRFLGLNGDCFDIENGRINFDMRDELIGNTHFNILHGGVIATILDTEGGFLLVLAGAWRGEGKSQDDLILIKGGTINMHIDYLRPGKGKHFTASGSILRRGNKVAVVQTELRNEENELIATGTGTYLIG